MLNFSSNNTREGHAAQLARHYPTGRVWAGKFRLTDSVLGKLIYAISGEWLRFEQFCSYAMRELDLYKTVDLIEEWEKSVGIPNAYFGTEVDLETRRLQVLMMLTDFGGFQTIDDFERVSNLFGFPDVTIRYGNEALFPLSFPILFFPGDGKAARHTVFITLPDSAVVFPLSFPIVFAADSGFILERIFRALLPANVDIVFLFGDT